MKKMFMMMLLSIVSWTGAVTAAEATAPLESNAPAAQQEAVVADTLNGMTPSEAFQIRMKELAVERDRMFFQEEPDAEDIIDCFGSILLLLFHLFLIAFLIVFFYIYYRNKKCTIPLSGDGKSDRSRVENCPKAFRRTGVEATQ